MNQYFTFFALIFSVSSFAVQDPQEIPANGKESFTYCIKENQKIDTSDWITCPITFGSCDVETGIVDEEKITVSLPKEPELIQANGKHSCYITVTDDEGMSYKIARMEIPSVDFSLKQSVNFLAESISISSSKRLIAWGCPNPNPSDSIYFIMWLEDDKMIMLRLVKSSHFVYFLETSISNKIYRDYNWESGEADTEVVDTMMRDSLKTKRFTGSFVIE